MNLKYKLLNSINLAYLFLKELIICLLILITFVLSYYLSILIDSWDVCRVWHVLFQVRIILPFFYVLAVFVSNRWEISSRQFVETICDMTILKVAAVQGTKISLNPKSDNMDKSWGVVLDRQHSLWRIPHADDATTDFPPLVTSFQCLRDGFRKLLIFVNYNLKIHRYLL